MARDELDWDDLRYFLRAAQHGTLAGAARATGVEHSTIGRRLGALERSLGMPLVLRNPDGLHLTPLGERLLPLVEQVEHAVLAVQRQTRQQPARVRLAMPSGFSPLFSANLARLAGDPPVSLEILGGARAVDLKKGEADLSIRSGPVLDEDLVARKLGTSGWSLYAAPSYLARRPPPKDLDDLSGHDLIGYDDSLAAVPAARWIEQRSRDAVIVLRSREMVDMLAAARSGAGLALLPCLLGDADAGLTRLTPAVVATRDLWLVYPRAARWAPPIQAVVRFVVDVMRENAERIAGTKAGR